jgi:hypothetical protein
MHTSAALALAVVLAAPGTFPPAVVPPHRENLLRGPARLVLRYLDAIRLAEPRATDSRARKLSAREAEYARAKRFVAPRALADAERHAARGLEHPLLFWRHPANRWVLEGFQLLAVRRAPRSSVVVTVEERHWDLVATDRRLARTVNEYLVARVDGEWRVMDRRGGGLFDDDSILAAYDGWWDEPISLAP